MKDLAKKIMLAGIGLTAISKREASKTFDTLVKKGELSKDSTSQLVKDMVHTVGKQAEDISGKIKKLVAKKGSKKGQDITLQTLNEKIDTLSRAVESLIQKKTKKKKTQERAR